MKLQLYPTLIFRTPKFANNETLELCLEELKGSIQQSSPEFYELIKDKDFDQLNNADARLKTTVWKYFNRARFRATPYGSFASVGTAELTFTPAQQLTIRPNQIIHEYLDWNQNEDLQTGFNDVMAQNILLFSNTSFYATNNEIRYLRNSEDGFEIAALGYHQEVMRILKFCCQPKHYLEVLGMLKDTVHPATIKSILGDMIKCQLLLTEKQQNIIGEEYFKRIGKTDAIGTKKYIIAERLVKEGAVDQRLFKHLPELTQILHCIMPVSRPAHLLKFIEQFTLKFEQAEIPLMQALDPELGIGYANAEQPDSDHGSIIGIFVNRNGDPDQANRLPALKDAIIKNLMIANKSPNTVLDLDTLIAQKHTEGAVEPLPNTLIAICTAAIDQIYLEYLGGVTANSLAGRFSLAIPAIEDLCREMAAIEAQANEGVLFFDIGYTNETTVDNVNRRKSIYPFQLNILNFDTSNAPLSIADLTLCVKRGKLILRSKSLNKRMMPRVASAYNYRRSDLSLFRLLCDLQHQDLHSNLLLRLKDMAPGLTYYPRMQFKNIVVSPATWYIGMETLTALSGAEDKVSSLMNYLTELNVKPYFKTGHVDQTLCFNINERRDIEILLMMLEKEKQLWLEEAPEPQDAIVVDTQGRPYSTQFMVSLYHKNPVVKPFSPVINIKPATKVQALIPPGKDWLYFEIFCQPYRVDILLQQYLLPYIKQNRKQIKNWFFIRYSEGGPHLRLRLQLIAGAESYNLIKQLSDILEAELEAGLVSDIRLRTYKREVYRYGHEHMERVENHFGLDSRYVCHLLKYPYSDMEKYGICVGVLLSISRSGAMAEQHFEAMAQKVLQAFTVEHQITTADYKELNNAYKDFSKQQFALPSKRILMLQNQFITSFANTVDNCDMDTKGIMLADLMHMHINRLFSDNQRTHEMVVYYFLQKELSRSYHKVKPFNLAV